VLLLVAAIGLAIQHRHNAAVEPLSKIIKPDIVRCHPASKLSMHGVTASLACSTSESVIGISAYQYGSAADFRAGLSHLDSITGWDPSAAGRQCPPPVGRSIGHEGWHTLFNPRYKTLRADQILQCYTDNGLFLYLWTLPSQRVILVAGDSASGASYTELQNWWNKLTYG
jgi:hypothetical protein